MRQRGLWVNGFIAASFVAQIALYVQGNPDNALWVVLLFVLWAVHGYDLRYPADE